MSDIYRSLKKNYRDISLEMPAFKKKRGGKKGRTVQLFRTNDVEIVKKKKERSTTPSCNGPFSHKR